MPGAVPVTGPIPPRPNQPPKPKLAAIDFFAVREFVDNYIKQDNVGTAWPYSYVLQNKKRIYVDAMNGDYTLYSLSDEDMFDCTKEEMLKYLKEEKDFEGDVPTDFKGVHEYSCEDVYEDVQWFLTEKEASDHLERNRHHYPEGRLYVKHWWRNPEMLMIMRTIFALAGKDWDHEAKMLDKREKKHG